MTEKEITILHCARCGKPFSYIPSKDDKCQPGTPNQICDACYEALQEENEP